MWLNKIISSKNSLYLADAYYEKPLVYYLKCNLSKSLNAFKKCLDLDIRHVDKIIMDTRFKGVFRDSRFSELIKPSKVKKINEYVTLKLFGRKTVLYVLDEIYVACQKLVLQIPVKNIESFSEYTSIDEFIEFSYEYGEQINESDFEITPEQEFWGHCSNIQAWVEHNYDSRLLTADFAFGILKKLADNGVKKARIIFKEEIFKRLRDDTGGVYPSILVYFLSAGYFSYFTQKELFYGLLSTEEAGAMDDISDFAALKYTLSNEIENAYRDSYTTEGKIHFYIENGYVSELEISLNEWNIKTLDYLSLLPRLNRLYIYYSHAPKDIGERLQELGFEFIPYYSHDSRLVYYKRN